MYYTLMVVAVVAFSFQFLFNQKFEERSGNGMKQSLTLQAGFSLSGLVVLSVVYLVRNGFTRINGLGWFTLMMTFFSALNSVAFMMCSMKALGRINISLYSMFTKPGLFNGYIAVTPAVALDNSWLLKYEEEFAKAAKYEYMADGLTSIQRLVLALRGAECAAGTWIGQGGAELASRPKPRSS